MMEPAELAELYFNRDPYPDFGFDLQLIVQLVSAQIVAAPNWQMGNCNPGVLDDYRKTAIEQLGKIKQDLTEIKQIRVALDESRKI